jgi:hypothetical protein
MTIHHATQKKAEINGIILKQITPNRVEAQWPERNVRIGQEDAKDALQDMIRIRTAMKSYPELQVKQDDDGTYVVTLRGKKKPVYSDKDVQEAIGTMLDEINDTDVEVKEVKGDEPEGEEEDAESEEIDEDEARGSIVKAKYRDEYKARGNPNHCSDWLALTLAEFVTIEVPGVERTVTGKDGETRTVKGRPRKTGSVEKTYAVAKANGVDKTWGHLSNGQQCMNARNMLRAKVIDTGELRIPARLTPDRKPLVIVADAAWLAGHRKDEEA